MSASRRPSRYSHRTMSRDSKGVASAELLHRAKAGEPGCLDELLTRYRERIQARVRLMLGPQARSVAESGDFLQDVFLDVIEGFDQFHPRGPHSFLAWASQIARNGIRDRIRRKREQPMSALRDLFSHSWTDDKSPSPSTDACLGEQVRLLLQAVAGLDADQRRVVELRHFEQMSFAEIAQRMQRSANAVQLLHARTLARLSALASTD